MGVRVTFGSTSRTERLRKGEFSGPKVLQSLSVDINKRLRWLARLQNA